MDYSQRTTHLLNNGLDDTLVLALLNLTDETFAHCRRVHELAMTLGIQMGLTARELAQLRLGAFLHDIGKQYVPPEVLHKQTPLTPEEWEQVEMHSARGWQLVSSLDLDDVVGRIILEHHVWSNGQGGYPQNSLGGFPCILTQIATVADVVDAMTSDRPYRSALSFTTCIAHLDECQGTRFNRDVVRVFKEISCRGFGGAWHF